MFCYVLQDYLEQCIQKLHVDPSQSDDERCTQYESSLSSQVNDSTDDAIIPLLGNEVMANHIEKSDRVSEVRYFICFVWEIHFMKSNRFTL